jgi:hypothetical protein
MLSYRYTLSDSIVARDSALCNKRLRRWLSSIPGTPLLLILAHYLPWFEGRPESSRWGWHWTGRRHHGRAVRPIRLPRPRSGAASPPGDGRYRFFLYAGGSTTAISASLAAEKPSGTTAAQGQARRGGGSAGDGCGVESSEGPRSDRTRSSGNGRHPSCQPNGSHPDTRLQEIAGSAAE